MTDAYRLSLYCHSHDGVFSVADAKAHGISRKVLRRWVETGRVVRLARGVYRFGSADASFRGRVQAARLAVGSDAIASHTTALALFGCRAVPDTIEVVRRYGKGARVDGCVVHRSRVLHDAHVTELDGIPITTPARTLLDLSGSLPSRSIGARFDELVSLGRMSASDLVEATARFSHLWKGRDIRAMWELIQARSTLKTLAESEIEKLAIELLLASDIEPPTPQYELLLEGRSMRLDLAWPAHKVAVELDGYEHHSSRAAFDADRDRDRRLLRAGWSTARFSAYDIATDLVRTVEHLLVRS